MKMCMGFFLALSGTWIVFLADIVLFPLWWCRNTASTLIGPCLMLTCQVWLTDEFIKRDGHPFTETVDVLIGERPWRSSTKDLEEGLLSEETKEVILPPPKLCPTTIHRVVIAGAAAEERY